MRFFWVVLAVVWAGFSAGGVHAQTNFIQIEAHPSLAEAESRARGYSTQLPNVNGFSLRGRWYGLALGPYPSPEAASAVLRQLRAQRAIPADSYLTEGETFGDRFWPAGAGAVVLGDEIANNDGVVEVAPIDVTPPPPVDETPAQARRSEAQLTRTEREDLQRALKWFGFYTARIDGSFGRGTRGSMAAWQTDRGIDATGILTTTQRSDLIGAWRAAQAAIGLEPLVVADAGISLTAPMGLVAFDRTEAPFVHYEPRDGSGVRMALISQPGDRAVLGGLYEVLQTLEMIPPVGARAKERDAFRIRGEGAGRTAQAYARLRDGHIVGYILSWPAAQDVAAARALEEMESTVTSVGAPLDPGAGFDASAQSFDMVSGLELRRPVRAASGFFVSGDGTVMTAAETVAGCGRVTVDRLHDAKVLATGDGVAVLRPLGALAPARVAQLAPQEGRLRSAVSVGGFPFGGVLGAATQSFGTLEDVRGLRGEPGLLRLSLEVEDGDAGGPVLDPSGHVTGMLLPDAKTQERALPGNVAFATKSRVLRDVLARAGITATPVEPAPALAPEDLVKVATAITVLVSCWE